MNRTPVTIITGFLGSGKTTLLTKLLGLYSDKKIAVIVNEFGEVGIDGSLLESVGTNVVELPGGALCCSALGDTNQALENLKNTEIPLDKIIIETTGLADPIPLIKSFFIRPSLEKNYELDCIVTVIDAQNSVSSSSHSEWQSQVGLADLIYVSKTIDNKIPDEVIYQVKHINPAAVITTNPEEVLSTSFVEEIAGRVNNIKNAHRHSRGITSVYLKTDKALSLEKVSKFIGEHLVMNGGKLLRYKGILNLENHEERFVFQGVGYTCENLPDRKWQPEEKRESTVVIIGENISEEEFYEAFHSCVISK